MSGTSLDGVDYALCEIGSASRGTPPEHLAIGKSNRSERNKDSLRRPGCLSTRSITVQVIQHVHRAFPAKLRQRLHAAAESRASSHETAQLHHDLGRFYATQAARVAEFRRAELIGLHGQTIFHHPAGNNPATLQLGEPSYLAEAFRVPVISNFRAADLAAGGEGAPLATVFHRDVFAEPGLHVCVHNLGGISNVTSIDWRNGKKPGLLAFDTGPANLLLDRAAVAFSRGRVLFDAGGRLAARGHPSERLLATWLKHPFFRKRPPKSTGREMFGEVYWKKIRRPLLALPPADALATLTEFTARSIAINYRLHLPAPPQRVILCGGGVNNSALVCSINKAITNWSPTTQVASCESLGWPAQSIEPAAFALLAFYRICGWPGNFPETTGAHRAVLLGTVTQP